MLIPSLKSNLTDRWTELCNSNGKCYEKYNIAVIWWIAGVLLAIERSQVCLLVKHCNSPSQLSRFCHQAL